MYTYVFAFCVICFAIWISANVIWFFQTKTNQVKISRRPLKNNKFKIFIYIRDYILLRRELKFLSRHIGKEFQAEFISTYRRQKSRSNLVKLECQVVTSPECLATSPTHTYIHKTPQGDSRRFLRYLACVIRCVGGHGIAIPNSSNRSTEKHETATFLLF